MFTLGFIVFFVFVQLLRNPSGSLFPARIIGFFYAGFGVMAIINEPQSVFLDFLIPGLLLLFASWLSATNAPIENGAGASR
jgi:hypothetical protein